MHPLRRDDYIAVSSITMNSIYSNTQLRIDKGSLGGAAHSGTSIHSYGS